MVSLLHFRVSSWLVLSLFLGSCAGAAWRCPLAPVATGAQLLDTTTITHDGIPRSWYTYVPASVAAAQAVVPLVVDLLATAAVRCTRRNTRAGSQRPRSLDSSWSGRKEQRCTPVSCSCQASVRLPRGMPANAAAASLAQVQHHCRSFQTRVLTM